jgi:hypothetical protein
MCPRLCSAGVVCIVLCEECGIVVVVLPCCRVAMLPCLPLVVCLFECGGVLFYTSLLTVLLPCCRVAMLPPSFQNFYSRLFRFHFLL